MPNIVELKVRDNGTFMYLDGLSKRTKKVPPEELEKLAKFGERALKASAKEAKIVDWRGKLQSGIEARKLSKKRFGIFIPIHGIYLDRMKPHKVWVKKGRLIYQWAQQKLPNPPLNRLMVVKPHPFIDRGYNRMVARTERVANKIANKIVRG